MPDNYILQSSLKHKVKRIIYARLDDRFRHHEASQYEAHGRVEFCTIAPSRGWNILSRPYSPLDARGSRSSPRLREAREVTTPLEHHSKPRHPNSKRVTRPRRRILTEWLVTVAGEAGLSPLDYLCFRFERDGASVKKLASEARTWIAANRLDDLQKLVPDFPGAPGVGAFPSNLFFEQFVLRILFGAVGTPDRDRLDTARQVSHAINAARMPEKMAAARANRRKDTPAVSALLSTFYVPN